MALDVHVRIGELDRDRVERFLDDVLPTWRDSWVWQTDDVDEIERCLGGELTGLAFYASRRSAGLEDGEQSYVILAFPVDGGVVMGCTIECDEDEDADDAAAGQRAVQVLGELAGLLGATDGFVGVEVPPPMSRQDWALAVSWASSVGPGWALVDAAVPTVAARRVRSSSTGVRVVVSGRPTS